MDDLKRKDGQALRGFTLIELIVVIVLIGVVSMVAYPRIADYYAGVRAGQGIRTLAQDLEYAEFYARTHADTVWVVLDPGSNAYSIFAGDSTEARQLLLHPQNSGNFVVQFGAGDHVSLQSTTFAGNTLIIDKNGYPVQGGMAVLNGSHTVSVASGTGRVAVDE